MKLPPLIDLHEDLSMYYVIGPGEQGFRVADFKTDLEGRHGDIPKYRRANLRLFFASIFPMVSTLNSRLRSQLTKGYQGDYRPFSPRPSSAAVFEHIKAYYSLVADYPRDLLIVRSKEDLGRCFKSRMTGLLMSIEGTEALEDTNDIDILYNLGLRALGFTWNYDTRYSASCMSKRDYGLTGEGQALLEEMNRLGVIVDLVHSSRKTAMTVLETSKLPVFNSHSLAKSVLDCARNLDDDYLQTLKDKRGVVGFIFAREMIGGTNDLNALVKHIMYIYRHFGPDNIAVGTDFFGLGDQKAPPGLEDITKVKDVWAALLDKGMKESDIEKISYKNALRVIEANASRWKPYA
jgi:membrane dipeptidase